jgi:predicted small integral membrane protein
MSELNSQIDQPRRSPHAIRLAGGLASIILLVIVGLYWWFQSESGPDLAWMAWTGPTAIFFITIATLLLGMIVWEVFSPGGSPRMGILRFETTRGDRLFLSLLGSAFITLGWLAWLGPDLWWALALCLVYAWLVFTVV